MIERHVGVLKQTSGSDESSGNIVMPKLAFVCVSVLSDPIDIANASWTISAIAAASFALLRLFATITSSSSPRRAKKISLADPRHQTLCDAFQKRVASRMAMRIVDVLKIIEID